MRPSSTSGRRVRLALLPLVWLIALGTVVGVLEIVAAIRGATFREAFGSRSLLPLLVALPSVPLGFVLGFIGVNALAYFTPLRRVFERERAETGRHSFAAAMSGLAKFALVLLLLTLVGSVAFLLLSS